MRNNSADIPPPITGESAMTKLYLSPDFQGRDLAPAQWQVQSLPLAPDAGQFGLVKLELLRPSGATDHT